MARRGKSVEDIVAHLPGVVDAVHDTATKIAVIAEARLAGHRDSGEAEIEVVRGGRTDSFVVLVDPAAVAIEFGHVHNRSGKWVAGLYIVTGAANSF